MHRYLTALYALSALAVVALAGATFALSARVGETSRQITAMEHKVTETSLDLAAASDKLDSLDITLRDDVHSRQASLEQAVAELARETALLQSEIAAISATFASLDADVGLRLQELAGQFDALQEEATALSSVVARSSLDAAELYTLVSTGVVEVRAQASTGTRQGTGFLVGPDARYVLTADHVVGSTGSLSVILADGTRISASRVGGIPQQDIAVLRLSSSPGNAAALTLADSSKVTAGTPVMVIGSPLGLAGTVTLGIVSATGREERYEGYEVPDMIQLDAAVNSGNSGGPAFNAQGEVIGMVVARVRPSVGDGLNFAIPAATLADALSSVLEAAD